jgi:hypothetical protein
MLRRGTLSKTVKERCYEDATVKVRVPSEKARLFPEKVRENERELADKDPALDENERVLALTLLLS